MHDASVMEHSAYLACFELSGLLALFVLLLLLLLLLLFYYFHFFGGGGGGVLCWPPVFRLLFCLFWWRGLTARH
jgi:hypothetical protein